jgi:hypothetical protein
LHTTAQPNRTVERGFPDRGPASSRHSRRCGIVSVGPVYPNELSSMKPPPEVSLVPRADISRLVREREQRGRNVEAEGLSCLAIDHKLKLARLLHREVCAPPGVSATNSVAIDTNNCLPSGVQSPIRVCTLQARAVRICSFFSMQEAHRFVMPAPWEAA